MSEQTNPLAADVEHIVAKYKPMPPELQAKILEIEKQRESEYRKGRIMALRQDWNAPKRHVTTKSSMDGPWGTKLVALEGKVGSGMLIGLVGIRGGGKTQMAVELMKASTRKLRSALFTTAMDFFITIKKSYRDDCDNEQQALGRYKKRKLLVIDEIGKRGETEWENNMLFEVINARYNDMLDTILIDNRSKAEFIATIGPSLSSRMNECGGIVECNWSSFRE